MAKADAGDSVGMDRKDLKRLLKYSIKEPVRAAFALGGDGKPIIMLDKRKQARALEKGIKDGAPDSKNHRFGTVMVDPDEPKIARFVINRAASGMAKKLIIGLKGTGFNKVRIMLEDGTDVEAAEGEPDEDDDALDAEADGGDADAETGNDSQDDGHKPAPSDTTAVASDSGDSSQAPADTSADSSTATTPASSSDSAPADGQPDAATLTSTLTALVKRMMGVIANDPSQKAGLAELATDAQASLKRGDLAQASAAIEVLRQAIESASGQSSGDQELVGSPITSSADTAAADATVPQDPTSTDSSDPQWEAGPSLNPNDTSNGTAPGAPGQGAPAASGQDAAGLTASLTALVKQLLPIVAADPSQRDALTGIVVQAQASLKSGDLDSASGHVDSLQAMLAGGGGPGAMTGQPAGTQAAPTNGAAPQVAKARLAWVATRKKIEGDLAKLKSAVVEACQGIDIEASLEAGFRSKVEPVLGELDESLSQKLDEVNSATDAAQRGKLVDEAKGIIQRYQAFVSSSPIISQLDTNPFLFLTIGQTLTATLSTLNKAVR
jgi:hypothetical protein